MPAVPFLVQWGLMIQGTSHTLSHATGTWGQPGCTDFLPPAVLPRAGAEQCDVFRSQPALNSRWWHITAWPPRQCLTVTPTYFQEAPGAAGGGAAAAAPAFTGDGGIAGQDARGAAGQDSARPRR